jgi:hypothetical protein
LLEARREKTSIGAHAGSTFAHVALTVALIFGLTGGPAKHREASIPGTIIAPSLEYWAPRPTRTEGLVGGGKPGGGGNENQLPPKTRELAPLSRIVLAPPRLPEERVHSLPTQVTMYDADAPEIVPQVKELGLPWMKDQNDSAGPGTTGLGNNPRPWNGTQWVRR